MNESIAKYSVLRYIPDLERAEFVNVGVVIHQPATRFLSLRTTTTLARVKAFDDEADLKFFKDILMDMQEEFSSIGFDGPAPEELSQENLLEEMTRHFVNQLQFSKVHYLITHDVQRDLEELFQTYVYYESRKGKRITQDRVNSLLARRFKRNSIMKYIQSEPRIDGKYGEQIVLDYGYQNSDLIKSFALTYRHSDKNIEYARTWAHTFSEIKEVMVKDANGREPVLISVVDYDTMDSDIEVAVGILESMSTVYRLSDADKLVEYLRNRIDSSSRAVPLNI